MSDVIYLVTGGCGEYSDRREWTVCWYPTEAEAQRHVDVCVAQDAALSEDDKADLRWNDPAAFRAKVSADPFYSTDYTGTHYTVKKVARGTLGQGG